MQILLLCMFLCVPVFACEQIKKDENFKYQLSKYKKDSGYFGVYQVPTDLTSGKRFYIFPDKTFAIIGFCDICMEEELLAKGEFEYSESKIILTFETPYDGNNKAVFYLRTGSKYFTDYIEGNDPLIFNELQLKHFSYKENIHSILHNIEPYPDWKIKSQDFKQKSVSKK